MCNQRHAGFVIGSDTKDKGREVWKVRVKDQNSPYNGQKLIVASVQCGLELARGLNVHFAIGTIDNTSGGKSLRAVDVCLEDPDDQTSNTNRSGGQHEQS